MNESFPWNPDDPLARVPKPEDGSRRESIKAHSALLAYWEMGPGRSLRKLQRFYNEDATEKPPTRHFRTLARWSTDYRWQARVARRVELWRLEMDEALREHRLTVLEQDWEHGQQLRGLAQKIFDAGLPDAFLRRRTRQGKPDVIDQDGKLVKKGRAKVITTALSTQDLARVEDLASKMGRLASEMETERAAVGVFNLEQWEKRCEERLREIEGLDSAETEN